MQSYFYLNADRTKGVFSQLSSSLVTKTTKETAAGLEASGSSGILSFLKLGGKASGSTKSSSESVITPEQMIHEICSRQGTRLVDEEDWASIEQGSLAIFKGDLTFDSFGLSREELWSASYDKIGERSTKHDLRLTGKVGSRAVLIPFSSNWILGPTSFSILCHSTSASIEGVAVVASATNADHIIMQPLAFGPGGFVRD
jgi:hypothetical protein